MAEVFISHRGADSGEAERLAADVRAAGHDVWLDTWKIGLGDSLVAEISAGLRKAKYVVLCYSNHGVDAPWISREWMSTLARQLEGHGIKILPVRLTGGAPPPIIADMKYADLVKDWGSGLRELLKAIQ